MTAIPKTLDSTCSLAAVAFAVASQSVRSDHDNALVEKHIAHAASALRRADLEAGRHELLQAADKALAGGVLAAGLQLAAASCQFQQANALGAGDQVAAKSCEAAASLYQASSRAGDILASAGQYDQADKVRFDSRAETFREAVQDSQRAVGAADDSRRRELAIMKDLADRAYDAAKAATRA